MFKVTTKPLVAGTNFFIGNELRLVQINNERIIPRKLQSLIYIYRLRIKNVVLEVQLPILAKTSLEPPPGLLKKDGLILSSSLPIIRSLHYRIFRLDYAFLFKFVSYISIKIKLNIVVIYNVSSRQQTLVLHGCIQKYFYLVNKEIPH